MMIWMWPWITKPVIRVNFFGREIEIYASSESWINNLSIDVWFVMIGQYLKIWNLREQKNLNIEKIAFKVVQMKFLAMHITNQKLSFDIFTVGNLQNIFMEHDLNILVIFGIKEKWIILTHTMYCCLLLQIYLCYLWLLLCSRDTCLLLYCNIYILNLCSPSVYHSFITSGLYSLQSGCHFKESTGITHLLIKYCK